MPGPRPISPAQAKKRLSKIRRQLEGKRSALLVKIPYFATEAEIAAALRLSKPTVVRMVRRGAFRQYRPNDPRPGVVLVYADSVLEHIEKHSYGGEL